jgi:hypothetical protein
LIVRRTGRGFHGFALIKIHFSSYDPIRADPEVGFYGIQFGKFLSSF